jgi:hypothetical protein
MDDVTLEQVEKQATRLTSREQIRLIAHISQRLSKESLPNADEARRLDYAKQVEKFLKMSAEMAAEMVREGDSAEDLRRMREERTRTI